MFGVSFVSSERTSSPYRRVRKGGREGGERKEGERKEEGGKGGSERMERPCREFFFARAAK